MSNSFPEVKSRFILIPQVVGVCHDFPATLSEAAPPAAVALVLRVSAVISNISILLSPFSTLHLPHPTHLISTFSEERLLRPKKMYVFDASFN